MSDQVVVPLRPRTRPGYTDTAALNDIHALLTTTEPGNATLGDIAVILARTGRPMVRARDIEITTTETALGWPVACAQAGDTSVYIRQDPTGPGLLIEICTKSAAEHDTLAVTLDGHTLHPTRRPAGARPDRRAAATGHLVQMRRSIPMSDLTDISPDPPASEPASERHDAEPSIAAASAAHADGAPALTRPMIAVALLTAHPGNVRRDLDLNADFLASIKENGVLVPLRITADADGVYRVIDGHRRLAAAVQVGLAEVPVDLAGDRAADEPGQFLDMWVAHRHRNPLTPMEEADALFAAREAGATKARIRKSTGLKPPAGHRRAGRRHALW